MISKIVIGMLALTLLAAGVAAEEMARTEKLLVESDDETGALRASYYYEERGVHAGVFEVGPDGVTCRGGGEMYDYRCLPSS